MLSISASKAAAGIQIGYRVSDITSKCSVGLAIYEITLQARWTLMAPQKLATQP